MRKLIHVTGINSYSTFGIYAWIFCIIYMKNTPIYAEIGILDYQWNKNIKLALTLQ